MARDLLRAIPKVDRLLASSTFAAVLRDHSRPRVLAELRHTLALLRKETAAGTSSAEDLEEEAIRDRVAAALARSAQPYYRKVINATGVVLHTGIGRAPLPAEALAALAETAGGSQRLEIDLETGERGGRDEGCSALLREITGCEAATVVNNNAGATLLMLAALARGKKVILSRGELVEIGGSFRMPDVMAESGAILVEVGTTNRTHRADYERAIDGETGMILKIHPSNYRVEGFTSEVSIEALAELGRERGIPVVHDLGSGCLVDLPGEPRVQDSLAAGVDLLCFSGDKLLGGPQAGILAGRKQTVDRCRRHPLMRALRPGRMTYTALEATLRTYLDGEAAAFERIPVLRRLVADPAELKERAESLAGSLENIAGLQVAVVPTTSQAGSGSLPAREIPSWAVQLRSELSATELAARLRAGQPAILARVREEAVLLDVRTLEDDDLSLLREAVADVFS